MRAIQPRRHTFRTPKDLRSRDVYYVYILRCVDDSFYIGHTNDMSDRVMRHNEGRADCSYMIN